MQDRILSICDRVRNACLIPFAVAYGIIIGVAVIALTYFHSDEESIEQFHDPTIGQSEWDLDHRISANDLHYGSDHFLDCPSHRDLLMDAAIAPSDDSRISAQLYPDYSRDPSQSECYIYTGSKSFFYSTITNWFITSKGFDFQSKSVPNIDFTESTTITKGSGSSGEEWIAIHNLEIAGKPIDQRVILCEKSQTVWAVRRSLHIILANEIRQQISIVFLRMVGRRILCRILLLALLLLFPY